MLADSYGRVATDLRVSLTDRCNLRCATACRLRAWNGCRSPRCSPTTRWCGWPGSASRGWASPRSATPAVSRCCAAGWPDIVARTAALRPRPEISLTTNGDRAGPAGAGRCAARAWTGSTCRWTRSGRTTFRKLARRDRLRRRAGRAGRGGGRRACPGQGERSAHARDQRRRGGRRCSGSAWSTAISCGSSSRCRWTPSTAGGGRTW